MGTTVNWRFLQSPRDASIISPDQLFVTLYTHLVFLLSSLLFNTDSSSERCNGDDLSQRRGSPRIKHLKIRKNTILLSDYDVNHPPLCKWSKTIDVFNDSLFISISLFLAGRVVPGLIPEKMMQKFFELWKDRPSCASRSQTFPEIHVPFCVSRAIQNRSAARF